MNGIARVGFGSGLAAGILFSLLAMGLVLAGCTAPPAGSGGAVHERVPTAQARAIQPAQGRLLYLAPDDQNNLQLTQLPLSSNDPIVLTRAPYGIMDYAVSDDGRIVYSAWREDEGTELWAIQGAGQDARLLVPCENAACGRIAWAPTGNQFTYEIHGGAGGPGTPALWQFDWDTQTTQPMAIEDSQARVNASWSPDGSWLSYFLADEGVIRVVHVADGRSYDLPNNLGDPVAWDPAGNSVVSLEVKPDGNQMLAHLTRLDLDTGDRRDIGSTGMADRQPAWSPTGDWLAVTRRDWTGAYPSKTQIWLMRGHGTDAHAVLADPDIQYLSPVWSSDGRFLLFQRYSSDQSFVQPEVWMLELETGQTTQVLPSAGQVVWLP